MADIDNESLFSLELVVDKLFIPGNITCRFPTVAFRFLDLPTLVIHHIEPDVAEKIRDHITQDAYIDIPAQINDLKDKSGKFLIKKGKSSLLKVSAKTLHSHLNTTPLYIMIVDAFPATSKLVGHVIVPMAKVMDRVYSDVSKFGISFPTAHGEKGVYSIYNLMGNEIGNLELGYRLLSLGVGLTHHIPEQAITTVSSELSHPLPTLELMSKDNLLKPESMIHIEKGVTPETALTEKRQEYQNSPKVKSQSAGMQTIYKKYTVHATQTENTKTRKQEKKDFIVDVTSMPDEMDDDIYITNTVCPPPLFYNSGGQSKPGATVFTPGGAYVKRKYAWNETHECSSSDDETIRTEDRFSDDDEISCYKRSEKQKHFKKETITSKSKSTTIIQETVQQTQGIAPLLNPAIGNQFPLLNALMTEIVAIQNQGMPTPTQNVIHAQPTKSPRTVTKQVAPPYAIPTPAYLTDRKILDKSIVNEENKPRNRYRDCFSPQQGVPKNKSWIRKEPTYGVRKTKLTYGLTNTQRLRLAKTNPDFLKVLEAEEADRTLQRSQQLQQVQQNKGPSSPNSKITKTTKYIQNKENTKPPKIMKTKTFVGQSKTLNTAQMHRTSSPKKTVTSKASSTQDDHSDESLRAEPGLPISVSAELSTLNIQSPIPPVVLNENVDHSYGSQRSINIHIPTSSMHDDDSDSESISDFGSEAASPVVPPIINYNPGFPLHTDASVESRVSEYSEDFESSKVVTSVEDFRKHSENTGDSDGSDSGSYKSVLTEVSRPTARGHDGLPQPLDKLNVKAVNPVISSQSPVVVNKQATYVQNVLKTESYPSALSEQRSSSQEDVPVPSPRRQYFANKGKSTSTESETRPTPRPRLKSKDHWSNKSFDDNNDVNAKRPVHPAMMRRSDTAGTDSVSTYVPSDLENLGLSSEDQYSDGFEDEESEGSPLTSPEYVPWKREPKHISDVDFKPASMFGYTC